MRKGVRSRRSLFLLSFVILVAFLLQFISAASRTGFESRRSSVFTNNFQQKLLFNFMVLIITCLIAMAFSLIFSTLLKQNRADTLKYLFPFFVLIAVLPTLLKLFHLEYFSRAYMNFFRIGFMETQFADLRIILLGISCKSVNEVGDPITCAISDGSPAWIYPSILLKLRLIGVSPDIAVPLALFFLIVFILLTYFFFKDSRLDITIFVFLLLISPATFLLIERMNLDLAVLILLFLATSLFFSKNNLIKLSSTLLIATLAKYYAITSFFVLFYVKLSKLKFFIVVLILLPFCLLLLGDILDAVSTLPGDTIGAFGWRNTLCMYSGCQDIRDGSLLKSLLLFMPLAFIAFRIALLNQCAFSKLLIDNLNDSVARKYLVFSLISAPVALCYWLLTSNYWYRLTISIFCIIAIKSIFRSNTFLDFVVFASIFSSFIPMGTFANVTNLFFTLLHFTIFCYLILIVRERNTIRSMLSKNL